MAAAMEGGLEGSCDYAKEDGMIDWQDILEKMTVPKEECLWLLIFLSMLNRI